MKKLQVAIDDQIYKIFKMSCTASDSSASDVLEDLIYQWAYETHPDVVQIVRKENLAKGEA